MRIAIHGAQGTGKEVLALELAVALGSHRGHEVKLGVLPPMNPQGADLALVCGLDWPSAGDQPGLYSGAIRESEDNLLRAALTEAGVKFQVIYGWGDTRVAKALQAIDAADRSAPIDGSINAAQSENAGGKLKWQWNCEKCSDSSCEHRLFSELVR